MKVLYNSKEKRTVLRLFLWFLLIAGNVHFYYILKVSWALETASRIETAFFVSFIDITMFLSIVVWQDWDGFDIDISIRYFFSFGLSILSYAVFYPAFYNYIHAIEEIKEIYTLSGHPVVLSGYAVLAAISAFWTFTGMFPTEAFSILNGRDRRKRFANLSNSILIWMQSKIEKHKDKKVIPEKKKVIDMDKERERSFIKQ